MEPNHKGSASSSSAASPQSHRPSSPQRHPTPPRRRPRNDDDANGASLRGGPNNWPRKGPTKSGRPNAALHQRPKPHHHHQAVPSQQMHRTTYEPESGLVFQEAEVSVGKKQHSDWIGEYKTPSLVRQSAGRNVRVAVGGGKEAGARSLFDMAKTRVVLEVRSLTPLHLLDVPWVVAEKIWEEVRESRAESFHVWRTFASVYPDHFKHPSHRYQIDVKHPTLPLADYFRGLSSSSSSSPSSTTLSRAKWLTCLRIAPKQTATADLVQIAKISNLAVLDLSNGLFLDNSASNLDERIFRTWSDLAAAGDGAFRHLHVLMLGWQDRLSQWVFKYLAAFPSLRYFIVTDCEKMHQRNRPDWEEEASRYGWVPRSAKQSAKSLRPLLDEQTFHLGAISGCYYKSLEQEQFGPLSVNIAAQDAHAQNTAAGLPVLECWIGTPRPWTHIIEEFPGSRTVWFDPVTNTAATAKVVAERVGNGQEKGGGERGVDQIKRVRETETQPTHELRSPSPKKRTSAKQRRRGGRNATDLLAEFGVHVPREEGAL